MNRADDVYVSIFHRPSDRISLYDTIIYRDYVLIFLDATDREICAKGEEQCIDKRIPCWKHYMSSLLRPL